MFKIPLPRSAPARVHLTLQEFRGGTPGGTPYAPWIRLCVDGRIGLLNEVTVFLDACSQTVDNTPMSTIRSAIPADIAP